MTMDKLEAIAARRDAEDAKWRDQYRDIRDRQTWHEMDTDHDEWTFAECPSRICRGEMPIPGVPDWRAR